MNDEVTQYLRDKFNRERPEDKGNEVLFESFVRNEIDVVRTEMTNEGMSWVKRVADSYLHCDENPIEVALLQRMLDYGVDLFCDDLEEAVIGDN